MEATQMEAIPQRPNGPVAAVLLASGIGSLVLGVLTTWAAASEEFGESLQYVDRVGPLSGKTLWATGAFIVSWIVLGVWLRRRNVAWAPVVVATVILVALGILGTFPTFFQSFE